MASLAAYTKSLRPAQWLKNGFIFLPLFFGKTFLAPSLLLKTFAGALLFCMASSAVYLFNDAADNERDRAHPVKKQRPVASGALSLAEARKAAVILLTAALCGSFFLGFSFFAIVAAYAALNLAYTFFIKHAVAADVICIAFFFLLRLEAGSILAGVKLSFWILLLTILLALFLGLAKRRQEMVLLGGRAAEHRPVLKDYHVDFLDPAILAAGILIMAAYALYAMDSRTRTEFGGDHMILTVPFVVCGIFRSLYRMRAGCWDGDPVRAVLVDPPTWICLLLWLTTSFAVIYMGY